MGTNKLFQNLIFVTLKKNLGYLFLIFCFACLLFMVSMKDKNKSLDEQRVHTVLFQYDENNVLTSNLIQYMKSYCKFTEVNIEKEEMNESLFMGKVDCVLVIPSDFTSIFLKGKGSAIQMHKVKKNGKTEVVELALADYMSEAEKNRQKYGNNLNQIIKDMSSIYNKKGNLKICINEASNHHFLYSYFNACGFFFTLAVWLLTGSIIFSLRQKNISDRIRISPISFTTFRRKIVFYYVMLWIGAVVVCGIFSIFFMGLNMISSVFFVYIINLFLYIICMMSLAFLLVFCFPLKNHWEMLSIIFGALLFMICSGNGIQSVFEQVNIRPASLFPTFWFLKNNNDLKNISISNISDFKYFFVHLMIITGFTVVYFVIALIISEKKVEPVLSEY